MLQTLFRTKDRHPPEVPDGPAVRKCVKGRSHEGSDIIQTASPGALKSKRIPEKQGIRL